MRTQVEKNPRPLQTRTDEKDSSRSSLASLSSQARLEVGVTEPTPLCVDLDGTLIRSDSLWDAAAALFRAGLQWMFLPLWLLRGKAHFKRRVAQASPLDVTTLPYRQDLVDALRDMEASGRQIVLCTGADRLIAEKVAQHLGIFCDVLASDGERNMVGERKRELLETRFGKRGFGYVANSRVDLPVWRVASEAQVAGGSSGLVRRIERHGVPVTATYEGDNQKPLFRRWLKAIRLHQWAKNTLVFLPLLLGHRFEWLPALAAFLAFGLVASSGYVINDVLDLDSDRRHPKKRTRPFANGDLPIPGAVVLVVLFMGLAAGVSLFLPPMFWGVLAGYFLVSVSYSIWLKKKALVDVLALAGLYTVRIAAGGVATGIVISPWTLAFSVFLFLSLATIKRVTELNGMNETSADNVPGRGYQKIDLDQLKMMGVSAGYMSVLVTALYINSPNVQPLYRNPEWLWFMLPVQLYWISRIWLLTNRGQVHHDPVVFALRDPNTYVVGAFAALVAYLAL